MRVCLASNHFTEAAENFRNATLITEVCREDVPKLCSRLLISSETRPCSPHGKYHPDYSVVHPHTQKHTLHFDPKNNTTEAVSRESFIRILAESR